MENSPPGPLPLVDPPAPPEPPEVLPLPLPLFVPAPPPDMFVPLGLGGMSGWGVGANNFAGIEAFQAILIRRRHRKIIDSIGRQSGHGQIGLRAGIGFENVKSALGAPINGIIGDGDCSNGGIPCERDVRLGPKTGGPGSGRRSLF